MLLNDSELSRLYRLVSQYKLQIRSNMFMYKKFVTGKTWMSIEPYADQTSSSINAGIRSPLVISLNATETGRRPGNIPHNFKDIIYKWSLDKGLSFKSNKDRARFSYLTARKIMRSGTAQFRKGAVDYIFTKQWPSYEDKMDQIVYESIERNVKERVKFL